MPTEQIGEYEIEYEALWLADVDGWAAYVTIYGPSPNPMHRNMIVPHQRVAVKHVFATRDEASNEARTAALAMLEHTRGRRG